MREIKFRAWDEQRKIMHVDFQFIKSGDCSNGESDWIIPLKPLSDPEWINTLTEHCKEAPHFRQQFNLMQYTGLKDKNGKEIYEGDIVNTGHRNIKNLIVIYRDGGFSAEGYEMGDIGINPDASLLRNCEVMGNIYEHPNLLTANT